MLAPAGAPAGEWIELCLRCLHQRAEHEAGGCGVFVESNPLHEGDDSVCGCPAFSGTLERNELREGEVSA
jgi:hypothetical protein